MKDVAIFQMKHEIEHLVKLQSNGDALLKGCSLYHVSYLERVDRIVHVCVYYVCDCARKVYSLRDTCNAALLFCGQAMTSI